MQFKHPELLWGLLLLLIPIFIHLFQLRRFQKTPFTNVKFLKKVVSESRRSSVLKKWLLLFTRLLLLAALVLAFAQPFFAEKSALKEKEMVVYLDDSFSMEAKSDGATLLSNAVQSLLKALPKEEKFSLITNTEAYRNVELAEVQNDLLQLQPNSKQLQLEEVLLKSRTFFSKDASTVKNLIVISDFQERFKGRLMDTTQTIATHLTQMQPDIIENVALDSVYLTNAMESVELTVLINKTGELESLPVSLYNGDQLIAKSAATFGTNNRATVSFSLPQNEVIKGKLEITDTGLTYDNQLYFSVNRKDKIKVLAVGDDNAFLSRIYTNDEFDFSSTDLRNLDYSLFQEQNLIVLNELRNIPNAMATSIKTFTDAGGKLVFIPAKGGETTSYNILASNYFATSYRSEMNGERNITKINFAHPLYRNVFEKQVANFQYPKVDSYFLTQTNAPALLSLQNDEPFLVGGDRSYFFMASISSQNSNYKNSPLIVPTFYNMGKSSLQLPTLYSVVGQQSTVDIVAKLDNDRVLKTVKDGYEFIPQQQVFSNRVRLGFAESPTKDGIYEIKDGEKSLQDISFNYERKESELIYNKPNLVDVPLQSDSIASLFGSLEKDNSITALWKWFVILAMLFLLIEILIQKYL